MGGMLQLCEVRVKGPEWWEQFARHWDSPGWVHVAHRLQA
jgi:hypothetical protein